MKTKLVAPLLPSLMVTSSIDSVVESSLIIVASPMSSTMETREATSVVPSNCSLEIVTVNVSSISTMDSAFTSTVTVVVLLPAERTTNCPVRAA